MLTKSFVFLGKDRGNFEADKCISCYEVGREEPNLIELFNA
jgi:hypothetical protein